MAALSKGAAMTAPRSTATDPSPFTCLEDAFASLSLDPRPLSFDGRTVPGLPDRAIPLFELRARLLRITTPYATRDAVVSALVARAQEEGGAATIALAGMLLPGLRRAAWPLVRACPDRAADVEADMLAGLLAALATVSPGRTRLAGALVGMAFTAAKRTVREELAERGRATHASTPAPPHRPFGHPDLVLGEAVLDGVITPDDAALIGATRLEGQPLKQAAYERGVSYVAIRLRRSRAERRLVAYLVDGSVPGDDGDDADEPAAAHRDIPRRDTPRRDTNSHARASSTGATSPRQGRRHDRRPDLCHYEPAHDRRR
jgi:hypothetical protein